MLTMILLGLVGLSWVAIGVVMITAPGWWHERMGDVIATPPSRFLLTQGMILGGLVLMLGTSAQQGFWLWGTLGALLVAKALVLLGAPESLRERLIGCWKKNPMWLLRLGGVLLMALATLLAIDTLRGGL